MVEAAFYGDDFTGSTDALLQFARCGLRGVLLVDLPPIDELHALATRYDVIGVAGIARSLPPDEQEAELLPVLTVLRDLNPRVVQYKICSTADSSPELGSIGRALEVGRSVFGPATVPILAAQPDLGRYTVFSHHFAAESGTIHRLDRQPTMADHPATPMRESDLRRHVADQTDLCIAGLHLTDIANLPTSLTQPTAAAHLTAATADAHRTTDTADLPETVDPADIYRRTTADAVVLDALTDADLGRLGRMLLACGNRPGQPFFAIGSGGLSRALALNLEPTSESEPATVPPTPETSQTLVVSGSQSHRTKQQIAHAEAAGWISLDLRDPALARQSAVNAFHDGAPGVVVHTGHHHARHPVSTLGEDLAAVVHAVVHNTSVRRIAIAGGDTSGHVLRRLRVTALSLLPNPHRLSPGTVLCQATSPSPTISALHLLLKPGQLGAPTLFESFRST